MSDQRNQFEGRMRGARPVSSAPTRNPARPGLAYRLTASQAAELIAASASFLLLCALFALVFPLVFG